MKDQTKEAEVEVEVPNEEVDQEKIEPKFDTEGLSEKELEDAKKLGFVNEKEDGEHEEQPKDETDEDSGSKKEESHPTFEEVDKDKNLLSKYNKNEQALYFKYKSDKRKRQEAEERYNEIKAEIELNKIKEASSQNKLKKVRELLADESRELTTGEILKIIESGETPEDDSPAAKELAEKKKYEKIQKDFQSRIDFMEEMGRAQYPDFDNLVNLANEVVVDSPKYKKIMATLFNDPEIEPQDIIEEVVSIAKRNPKYQKTKEATPKEQEKVERAIKNSKKVSSASISSSGRNLVPESQITIDQAARLSVAQYRKLSPQTRKRLEMGIDP